MFLRALRGSGIDPLNAADLIEHANTIHALQWPRVFRRWQQYLIATGDTVPPRSVLDIINRVQMFEGSRGRAFPVKLAQADDALQAWHTFRMAPEQSDVISV